MLKAGGWGRGCSSRHNKMVGAQNKIKQKWASLVAQTVKNLLAMWETWVRSLGWEDPLENGMANPSKIESRGSYNEIPRMWEEKARGRMLPKQGD